MYYKFKSNYLLRGWQKLPYALVDNETNQILFATAQMASIFHLCNGKVDLESLIFTQQQRDMLEKMHELGYLEKHSEPSPLLPEQEYHQYPSRFIRSAHWSITGRCNYRCKHCYMSAPHAKFGELSHEQCMRIVEQLAECGIHSVSLTGGEPLLRKDFMEIVKALLARNIRITTIYSNGKLVTEELLKELVACGIRPEFNLSFDGVGWHDWLRGIDGAEKIAINAFRLCHEMGFPTGAELCLHRGNKDTLRESVKLLGDLNVRSLKISPVVAVGEWSAMPSEMSLTDEEVYETYLEYLPKYIEDGRPMGLMLGNLFACDGSEKYIIPGYHNLCESNMKNHCICGHARTHMYIAADGRILPCMPLAGADEVAAKFPLITETELKDALNDSWYMSCIDTKLKDFLENNEECSSCEHRLNCAGGCRGSALNYDSSNYYGIDRAACLLFKNGYIGRLEKIMEQGNLVRKV